MALYHYTCEHGRKAITSRGFLRPTAQPVIGGFARLVWLTDMETPDRFGLGLTSQILDCDRMEYRYVVEADDAQPWSEWAQRRQVAPFIRLYLEEGRMPERWFVSERAVFARLDRAYVNLQPLRSAS